MTKHRATHHRRERPRGHRATRRRRFGRTGGIAGLAVLAAGALIAVPVAVATKDRQALPRDVPAAASSAIPSTATPKTEMRGGRVEVSTGAHIRLRTSTSAARVPERGTGTFQTAPAPPADTEGATTYRVEVESGLPFSPGRVSRLVEATFADERGWTARHQLARVDGDADLRLVLASPETADALCAPLETGGRLSCRNGSDVVLNAWRWQFGADSYAGDLRSYRHYVVNHETGHALGYPHVGCPGPGEPAPVMVQQTKGLEGCEANPWPALVDLVGH